MKNFILILATVFICISCDDTPVYNTLQGSALGTGYTVQFYSDKKIDVKSQFDSVVEAINQSMSTYRPTSDISRINAGDSTVVVDTLFKEVLSLSRKIFRETKGYYDPTVGILANAYGFGPDKPIANLDSVTIDSLKQYVGLEKIKLLSKGTLLKEQKKIYLDFNSIAKGYCIDQIGKMLEANGVEHYLIELGGELLAKGQNLKKQKSWAVGIENIKAPVSDRQYTQVVKLQNKAMAGSGNYRKYRIDSLTGKKYVHTINPITGQAEKSDVLSATVIAKTCAEADAYATAFMALGIDKSKEVLSRIKGVEAYLMYAKKDSSAVYITNGFEKYLVTN